MPALTWDVGKVESFQQMFEGATAFNQELKNETDNGPWDTQSCTNMMSMFSHALAFDQDVGGFDVSNVETMVSMFNNARAFNNGSQAMGGWAVDSVTTMAFMFHNAIEFNQNINAWGSHTGNLTDMQYMFATALTPLGGISGAGGSTIAPNGNMKYDQPMNGWDVSAVTNMTGLFRYTGSFRQLLSMWNVSSVTAGNFGDWKAAQGSPGGHSGTHMFQGTADVLSPYFDCRVDYQSQTVADKDRIDQTDANTTHWYASEQAGIWLPPWNSNVTIPLRNVFITLQQLQQALNNWMTMIDNGMPPELAEFPGVSPSHVGPIKDWVLTSGITSFAGLGGPDALTGATPYTYTNNTTETARLFYQQATPSTYTYNGPTYSTCIKNWHLFNEYVSEWNMSNATSFEEMFMNAQAFKNGKESVHTGAVNASLQTAVNTLYPGTTIPATLNYGNTGSGSTTLVVDGVDLRDSLNIVNRIVTNTERMFKNCYSFNSHVFANYDLEGHLVTRLQLTNIEGMFENALRFNRRVKNLWVPNPPRTDGGSGTLYVTAINPFDERQGHPNRHFRVNNPLLASYSTNAEAALLVDINMVSVEITPPTVTSFKDVFKGAVDYNRDMTEWYWISKTVTTFESMFEGATSFNRDLSSWYVGTALGVNVQNMFKNASAFNQPFNSTWFDPYYSTGRGHLGETEDRQYNFNTTYVTNMLGMFEQATAFVQPIGWWDVSEVTGTGFNSVLTGSGYQAVSWNNTNHRTRPGDTWAAQLSINGGATWQANTLWEAPWTGYYFRNADELRNGVTHAFMEPDDGPPVPVSYETSRGLRDYGNLQTWNTSDLTSMQGVCKSMLLNHPGVAKWRTAKCKNMESMFQDCPNFNQSLNNWDVSVCENMKSMFKGAVAFNNGS
tara:strand:- start:323 stop:3004 length:2682 start_codon:yes stop_codon:yes gene_type:complete